MWCEHSFITSQHTPSIVHPVCAVPSFCPGASARHRREAVERMGAVITVVSVEPGCFGKVKGKTRPSHDSHTLYPDKVTVPHLT